MKTLTLIKIILLTAIAPFLLPSCGSTGIGPMSAPTLVAGPTTAYSADVTVNTKGGSRTFKIFFDAGSINYFTALSIATPEYISNIQPYPPGVMNLPDGEVLLTSTSQIPLEK